ncbi:hypothetical protein GCM10007242_45620 [Pigmentiphaga litoralis]|uniref:hypothetical protein n=1 Tax=Pigmentiphaga litoralis TaxID=516702 RepID=UPI0019C16D5B|nr:hypothetical protein [Pigmentiphaga litoralis]GGX33335.1 hypothetical protein GCM10007242_45620 [Pigmentiphaga litoralis]
MFTVIQRTHKAGKQVDPARLEQPLGGTLLRKERYDAIARRQQTYMEFTQVDDPTQVLFQERPAELLDPQLLSFDSERGVMLVGFEVINGGRHYQGWWVRWYPEIPGWYREMMTPR